MATKRSNGWIRPDKRLAIMFRDGLKCAYCLGTKAAGLTLDHIIPRAKQGSNKTENLVTCCFQCNRIKQDISVDAFCKKQGYDLDIVTRRIESLRYQSIKAHRALAKLLLINSPLYIYTGNSQYVTNPKGKNQHE